MAFGPKRGLTKQMRASLLALKLATTQAMRGRKLKLFIGNSELKYRLSKINANDAIHRGRLR